MIFYILGIPSVLIFIVMILEWWKDSRRDKGAKVIPFETELDDHEKRIS